MEQALKNSSARIHCFVWWKYQNYQDIGAAKNNDNEGHMKEPLFIDRAISTNNSAQLANGCQLLVLGWRCSYKHRTRKTRASKMIGQMFELERVALFFVSGPGSRFRFLSVPLSSVPFRSVPFNSILSCSLYLNPQFIHHNTKANEPANSLTTEGSI